MLLLAPSRVLSFVDLLPYLFFKYRAHELSASLSPSDPPRSGDGSRDFIACVERLRDNSDPDDVPYLNETNENYFTIKMTSNARK